MAENAGRGDDDMTGRVSIDRQRSKAPVPRRTVGWGLVASAMMAGVYVGVLAWGSGWSHVVTQFREDWPFVVAIVIGFGVQVALMVELRRRHRLHAVEATAGGTGAGASAVGMAACCAHHLVDVAPFVAATGAAAFLAEYRVPFMIAGIALNAVGIAVAWLRLCRLSRHQHVHLDREGRQTCVAA